MQPPDGKTKIAKSALIGFAETSGGIAVGLSLWALGLPDVLSGLFIAACTAIAIQRFYQRVES